MTRSLTHLRVARQRRRITQQRPRRSPTPVSAVCIRDASCLLSLPLSSYVGCARARRVSTPFGRESGRDRSALCELTTIGAPTRALVQLPIVRVVCCAWFFHSRARCQWKRVHACHSREVSLPPSHSSASPPPAAIDRFRRARWLRRVDK